jgi:hypothetical protein
MGAWGLLMGKDERMDEESAAEMGRVSLCHVVLLCEWRVSLGDGLMCD